MLFDLFRPTDSAFVLVGLPQPVACGVFFAPPLLNNGNLVLPQLSALDMLNTPHVWLNSSNRPFAGPGHMVQNYILVSKLHSGTSKQCIYLCFGSPTAQLAHQYM